MTDRPKDRPLPPWLREQIERGLTQQQIADAWFEKTGMRVSRSTIAMMIHRDMFRKGRKAE